MKKICILAVLGSGESIIPLVRVNLRVWSGSRWAWSRMLARGAHSRPRDGRSSPSTILATGGLGGGGVAGVLSPLCRPCLVIFYALICSSVRTVPDLQQLPVPHDLSAQGRNLISCSYSQELCQLANKAPDWLHKSEQPIRSKVSKLT